MCPDGFWILLRSATPPSPWATCTSALSASPWECVSDVQKGHAEFRFVPIAPLILLFSMQSSAFSLSLSSQEKCSSTLSPLWSSAGQQIGPLHARPGAFYCRVFQHYLSRTYILECPWCSHAMLHLKHAWHHGIKPQTFGVLWCFRHLGLINHTYDYPKGTCKLSVNTWVVKANPSFSRSWQCGYKPPHGTMPGWSR